MTGAVLIVFLFACVACAAYAHAPCGSLYSGPGSEGTLAARIDAFLPQTQCGLCGYAGCRPYADAVARFDVEINRCPPGGERTVRRLAALLGRPALPLDATRGPAPPPQVALIDEETCIGCFKCVRACPVDAIIGAPKHMHTIIPEYCTGCGLCVPPCPVDCIDLVPPHYDTRRASQLADIAAANSPS